MSSNSSNNTEHKNSCPISVAQHGEWAASVPPECNCSLPESKVEKKCGRDGETMWCYCGKCKQEDYPLPKDYETMKSISSLLVEDTDWKEELKRQCEVRSLPYSDVLYLVESVLSLRIKARDEEWEKAIESLKKDPKWAGEFEGRTSEERCTLWNMMCTKALSALKDKMK